MSLGLYVHVPFCIRKCHYCDFVSFPLNGQRANDYLVGLQKEMKLYQNQLNEIQKQISTVYIGGGTPTCLSSGQLCTLLEALKNTYTIQNDVEFTVEANPGTLSKEKLKVLAEAGVNRISLGGQSFNNENLQAIGRIHSAEAIKEAFFLVREAGFQNINLDLIFALPKQTLADWLNTLAEAISLKPEHLSAYSLKIEEGTYLAKLEQAGNLNLPSEDDELAMYLETINFLGKAGYNHYEISNFAFPGKESQHNKTYWQNQEYLGLGPGAHSYLNRTRWANLTNLDEYYGDLKHNQRPLAFREQVDNQQEMAETMIMGLRLLEGVSLTGFQKRFKQSLYDIYRNQIEKLMRQGLLEVKNDFLRLTKEGLPLANVAFQEFV